MKNIYMVIPLLLKVRWYDVLEPLHNNGKQMKKPLFYIFCLIFMVVLLANGCQKKADTLDQLLNETVISNEEESLHYDPSDKSTVDSNLTPEINIGIVNDNAVCREKRKEKKGQGAVSKEQRGESFLFSFFFFLSKVLEKRYIMSRSYH
jgi:hypothetical protein